MKIAVVGCGLVGSSWALVFARAGLKVAVYDQSPAAVDAAIDWVRKTAPMMEANGLLNGKSVDEIVGMLTPVYDLLEAIGDADYIQESAPERVEIKRELYKKLGVLAKKDAVIASSTSGLPASSFSEEVEGRERVIVAHPINPPHLIPLIEIVPAPWTAPDVIERTRVLMKQIGQAPVVLKREINGFIVNRLQSAVLSEAFRLVEDGLCSVADVDAAMSDGLGMRWFFLGALETIDLNAQGGIADYCAKLGPLFYSLAKEQSDPRPWGPELMAAVEKQRRDLVPWDRLDERKKWRDRCLAAFVKAKRDVFRENAGSNGLEGE